MTISANAIDRANMLEARERAAGWPRLVDAHRLNNPALARSCASLVKFFSDMQAECASRIAERNRLAFEHDREVMTRTDPA
jgi:hypothetical protein